MTRTLLPWVRALLLGLWLAPAGCARNYTYYILDAPPRRPAALSEPDRLARPLTYGVTTTMKVRWNDGTTLTEVDVPVLASGQRIVIEHGAGNKDVKTIEPMALLPPPPGAGDAALVEAYRARGLKVDDRAADISLSRAFELVQEASRAGNHGLALRWCEVVLQRYPSHPEFLRAKASLLLLLGEKDKAVETYEKAEGIESNPDVRRKLEELQKQR